MATTKSYNFVLYISLKDMLKKQETWLIFNDNSFLSLWSNSAHQQKRYNCQGRFNKTWACLCTYEHMHTLCILLYTFVCICIFTYKCREREI